MEPGPQKTEGGSNWANFIAAVRANDKKVQNNEIEEDAISCTLMHLGNISYRLGRAINFDPVKLEITGDKEAADGASAGCNGGEPSPRMPRQSMSGS